MKFVVVVPLLVTIGILHSWTIQPVKFFVVVPALGAMFVNYYSVSDLHNKYSVSAFIWGVK
jgi:hypothetical protein